MNKLKREHEKINNQQGKMLRPQRKVFVELITDKGIVRAVGDENKGVLITIPSE